MKIVCKIHTISSQYCLVIQVYQDKVKLIITKMTQHVGLNSVIFLITMSMIMNTAQIIIGISIQHVNQNGLNMKLKVQVVKQTKLRLIRTGKTT